MMDLFLRLLKTAFIVPFLFHVFLYLFPDLSVAQSKAYRIGPRDILTLTIYAGGEEQQEVDLTVSAQGMINAPFIGSVKAEGLTIPQLEGLITEPLTKDYFVNPEVNIRIKEYHSLQYHISGAVKSPGMYEMSSKASLMELIAKAGGVLPERGNVAYILQASPEQNPEEQKIEDPLSHKEPIKVDLTRLLDKGDMSLNVILQSGDVVYIPLQKAFDLAESKIYVEGEVKKAGVYDYQVGLTALNACIMAGGFSKFAAPNRTMIIRKQGDKQETIKINLNDVKKGRIPDIELRPGDRIHVPETSYVISGAVKSPGMYEMSSKASLMELIAKAGGVLPERGNVAYILQASPEQNPEEQKIEDPLSHKEPIKVDLTRLLDKGDMSLNVILQSGDVVYIPLQKAFDLAESKIYVEGEVKKAGVYDYQVGLTALNACIMAGGFSKFAAPNRTMIIRKQGNKQETIKINLNDVKKGRIPDIELRPGDRIHVPETWL